MSNFLYVYGTLRPGNTEIFKVPGALYDLGWFPGIKLVDFIIHGRQAEVSCEKIEVKDWDAVDRYEGYRPADPASSLYIRRPFYDGFIYEFNQPLLDHKLIKSGDWLEYTQQKKGVAHERVG